MYPNLLYISVYIGSRLSAPPSELMQDPVAFVFMLLWVAVAVFILYHLLSSCFGARTNTNRSTTPRPPPPRRPGSGWFSGGTGPHPDSRDSPPPYSKYPPSSGQARPADAGGWRPGFWTGAALGWLGTSLMNRQARQREAEYVRVPGMYDWEAERILRPVRTAPYASSPSGSSWWGGAARRQGFDPDDRGEGPSNLGRIRRSTGFGGSSVR